MNQTPKDTGRVLPRTRVALALAFLGPAALGCSSSTAPLTTLWETTLNPVGASQVTGEAAAVTQFGRTDVSVTIRLGDPETEYPWRVESGVCSGEGTVQGGSAQYLNIGTDEAGTGEQQAQLAEKFRPGDKLSVKVFAPGSQSGQNIVACGILEQV